MYEIKNLTNSPYDLETVDGSVRLPAMGKATAKFSDEQLAAIRGIGMFEVSEIGPKSRADPLDHDQDGEKGGSKPSDPPALSGKNKAELLEIAAVEGAEIEEGATNDDIRAAIELNREG